MKSTANKNSDGAQKIRNYIQVFLESDYFQGRLFMLRKKYELPKNGLPLKENEENRIKTDTIIYFPDGFIKDKTMLSEISHDLNEITENFPLKNIQIQACIRAFFFHNTLPEKLINNAIDIENLCKIVDFNDDFFDKCLDDKKLLDIYLKHIEQENYFFPVAIKINPRASKRDVLRYIEKNWKIIQTRFNRYEDRYGKLGKIRKRNPNITKRDKVIHENRDKPYQEILKALRNEGIPENLIDTIDQGSIGKIKSLEKQERKEV